MAFSEDEMMSDLAAADAAGDSELAQHIAGKIKALRTPAAPAHGRVAEAAHKTASLLPAAGGIVGGALASPGIVTTALGAGIGAAGGKALQHFADKALGYENPTIEESTIDSAKTGATEGAVTGAGGMALGMLARAAKPLAGPLNALGNKLGLRVLTGGTTPLSARKPISALAIEEAFQQGAFRPVGTTQSAYDALTAARGRVGAEDAQLLAGMKQQGVTGSNAEALAKQLEAEAAQKATTSLMSPEPELFRGAAAELRTKPVDVNGNLGLEAQEEMKRELQFQAQREYDKISRQYTPTGEAKKALASRIRQAVEDSINQQSALAPDEAAAFIPTKQKFGRIAEAERAAEEGAARAARRAPVSLTDMLMAGAGHTHGGPLEGASGLALSKLARTYGPSTATWAAKSAAQGLQNMSPAVPEMAGAGIGSLVGPEVALPDLMALLQQLRQRRALPLSVAQNEQ